MNAPRLQTALAAALALALALAACGRTDGAAPTREDFEPGLRSFLAEGHDQLCLGLYDWPIDLTEAEAGAHSRHAVQLPVFEKLGLVRSELVAVPRSAENPDGAVKRYSLTDEGRKYYRPHAHQGRDGVAHRDDFCVARIRLDRVEGWQVDPKAGPGGAATVSYSYRVEPAPWLNDPEAQRVLPMVAKVLHGAGGGLQMHQGFVRDTHGWVPVPGAV